MDILKRINKELSLFTGDGGGLLGSKILGFRTVGAVEIQRYACGVLLQRQNDGSLDPFPIWTDIRSFTKRNNQCRQYIKYLKRIADQLIVSGGFPCQDISVAGQGKGIDGENSGLWREYFRLVCEIRPAGVYLENSPMLTSRGIDRILGNLASVGYYAVWGVLGASDIGANHYRKRIWLLAYTKDESYSNELNGNNSGFRTSEIPQIQETEVFGDSSNAYKKRLEVWEGVSENDGEEFQASERGNTAPSWWQTEPNVGRVVDGLAYRVDRLKGIGNGQVPSAMAGAFSLLNTIQQ